MTARQLLGWITRNLARIVRHSDGSVAVYGGRGSAGCKTDDPAAVLDAIRRARANDIRERAADRRDKRDGVWPYNIDHAGREMRPSGRSTN